MRATDYTYVLLGRVDTSHFLSREQIEVVKDSTRPGDEISFQKEEVKIEGVVDKVFPHIFILKDGRSVMWIDYILGSAEILHHLRTYHPIKQTRNDREPNYYSMKMARVE